MADYTEIIQEINTNLPDNNTQSITAAKLRTTLIDLTNDVSLNQNNLEGDIDSLDDRIDTLEEELFTVFDYTSYTEYNGNIIGDGIWIVNTNMHSWLVPISEIEYLKTLTITANANTSVIAWLTSNNLVNNQLAPFVSGTSRIVLDANSVTEITIPATAQYLYVFGTNDAGTPSDFLPVMTYEGSSIENLQNQIDSLDDRIEALEEGSVTTTDIISLNGDAKVLSVFKNSKKYYRVYGTTFNSHPLNLIHFTDLHGDSVSLSRIVEFRNHYSDYINDTICSGDIIRNVFSDDFTFWNAISGTQNILLVTGNQEYYNGESVNASDYLYQITQTQVYNKFFAPNISNWNVTQPSNAAENGLNYYYKDYSIQKIRLIVIDNFRLDSGQQQFVENALSGAKTLGYHVVMSSHYGDYHPTGILCNFNSNYPWSNVWLGIDTAAFNDILDAVDTFITDGGVFVGWLCGHTHVDFMGLIVNHPNQLQINASCANSGINWATLVEYCDQERTIGTKSQDLFNIVSIDTTMGYIKLYRIGADIDRDLRSRLSLCYDYINHTLIAQR